MPKSSTKAEFNNFVKGIITEASPLNFPENASLSEENYELDRDGTRARRLGMDLEEGGVLYDVTNDGYIPEFLPSSFKWLDANGEPDNDLVVVQEGNTLHFFDMNVASISQTGFLSSLTLTSFPINATYSITSVDGRLVVVCGASSVAVISYKNDVFSVEYTLLKTRDLWGISTGTQYDTDVTYRGPLNLLHYYNLQNQSWGIPRKNRDNVKVDPISYYISQLGKAPSNSETVWTGLQFQSVGTGGDPFERIYANLYDELIGFDVKTAKGYFIIDVMDRGASRMAAFSTNKVKYPELLYSSITLPADKTTGGPSYVAEFAGRVFYAGFNGEVIEPTDRTPNLANHIFFTQLIRSQQEYGKCYQEGDPSSRDNSDIVDTDGGFIRVAGADRIIGMQVLGNSLILLASNGVWAITGGSEYGFTATNYRVDKLSSFGCISSKSIVSDGSKLLYWAEDGIYIIRPGENGGLVAVSITETTIQSLYQEIDNADKQTASGVYDTLGKKIRWIYRTGNLFASDNVTYELVLDLTLSSFYRNRIYNTGEYEFEVIQAFDSNKFVNETITTDVYVGSDPVVSSSAQVVIDIGRKSSANRNVRYLTLKKEGTNIKYTFAYYKNDLFLDWNATDAKAYVLTGAITAGDSTAKKQVPYLLVMMRATESGTDSEGNLLNQSACNMRFQWDWTDNPASNRWSLLQKVYRLNRVFMTELSQSSLNDGQTVVVTKNKVRGKGRAFSVYFETEPLKDCQILGWNISLNAVPIT